MTNDGQMTEGTSIKKVLWWAAQAAAVVFFLGLVAWQFGLYKVRGSLPVLDGEIALEGLAGPVSIDRDAAGVPTISAESRIDVARGLGFAHGQDRFFQMDLSRRFAAGELAEILGDGPLPVDRRNRLHRFKARAEKIVAQMRPFERRFAVAYAQGVNAGLESLREVPFEYLVLDVNPEPWTPADTILSVYSMYLDLNDGFGEFESARGLVADLLGDEMLAFLDPLGTEWDAPIVGEAFEPSAIPGPEVFDLRQMPPAEVASRSWSEIEAGEVVRGSNNWAIAGSLTADGRALLANDMHLGIQVPNLWYRVVMRFPDETAPGGNRRLVGVTLPGAPFVLAGSNGEVAWGFTNTWGDWEDWVLIEPDPQNPGRYLSPEGSRPIARFDEEIRSKSGGREALEVRETVWGPILGEDHLGRERAYRWIAHDPQAVTFTVLELELASTIDEATEIANRIGAPPQNFVVADADGRIGWTVMGPIPRRFGHDGRTPTTWRDGSAGWNGYLEPDEYPRVVDPDEGRIWTANSRVVDGEMMEKIGIGTYRLGARSQQIRDGLRQLETPTEEDLLGVQLDHRGLFVERWRELLLEVLEAEDIETPERQELGRLAEEWDGNASVDSAGYRMVRAFRSFLADQVYGAILARCQEADESFGTRYLIQQEGALWRLIEERPLHFLDPKFESWQDQFSAVIDELLTYFGEKEGSLSEQTWGRRNTVSIRHPMSRFLPTFLAKKLDMPSEPLPGDAHMPRFQGPSEGASERLVVSPGREEDGIFHMPTGQSGHPLSPFYRAGHGDWVVGNPTPFLPGEAAHTLTLIP